MHCLQKYNDGHRYLLVYINVFSKFTLVIPLKLKTGLALVEAFRMSLALGEKARENFE